MPPSMTVRDKIRGGAARADSGVDPRHLGLVYGYDKVRALCPHCRERFGKRRFGCKRCRTGYCSVACRVGDRRAHRAVCASVRRIGAWYVDCNGMYLWQPVIPLEFEPVVGATLTVLLRLRTPEMVRLDCNGCSHHHLLTMKHCSAYDLGRVVPTRAQRVFQARWDPSVPSRGRHAFMLFGVGPDRVRFAGTWSIESIAGMYEDGYRSGQSTMTCESI